MTERFALYFSPRTASELALFAESVLGRTPATPRRADATSSFADTRRWRALTEKPAYYGFHATLKAPFELADRHSLEHLLAAVAALAESCQALPLKGLAPRQFDGIAALTLAPQSVEVSALAMACVRELEPFRRALSEHDRRRRMQQNLSARQLELLDIWGYPYVDKEFRFHMTVTTQLADGDADLLHWICSEFSALVVDEVWLDQLAIYHQPDRDTAFTEVATFNLQRK